MAKTAKDFYAEGQNSARAGCTQTAGKEYMMPNFGEGNGWQNRAFAQGFRDECVKLQRKVIPCAYPWKLRSNSWQFPKVPATTGDGK